MKQTLTKLVLKILQMLIDLHVVIQLEVFSLLLNILKKIKKGNKKLFNGNLIWLIKG
jgi:hypothetical protein